MKKVFKKILVFVLCMSVLSGTDAYACGNGMTSTLSTISDLTKRLNSVFVGSQNEKADVDFTIDQGEIFEARKYFSDSHASTIVKMPNGNLMSAFFAGTAEGDEDVRIWYSIYDGEWSEPKQMESSDPVAHWNPVLVNYGSYVRLYYKVGMEIPYWVTKYTDSYDNRNVGHT